MDKRWEYLKRAQEKQREKYLSPENVEKRRERGILYKQRARSKQIEKQLYSPVIRRAINKVSSKMKEKHEEDALFYEQIWTSRPHYCENCHKFLGDGFKDKDGKLINLFRYAHIIPKSIYPYLRHYDKNIMLLCLNCHTQFDNSPKNIVEKMNCYDGEHIEQLKELHKELEKNQNNIYK